MTKKILLMGCLSLLSIAMPAKADFKSQRGELFAALPVDTNSILMVGNSITNGNEWSEAYANAHILNRGISGNTSTEVLGRLSPLLSGHPRAIFLLIGINDGTTASATVKNISNLLDSARLRSPRTQLFVQSVLPVNSTFNRFGQSRRGDVVAEINRQLPAICQAKGATFLNVYPHLVTSASDSALSVAYTNDGLHMLGSGYRQWTRAVKTMLGEKLNLSPAYSDDAFTPITASHTYINQRLSDFALLPVKPGDVLMLGDYYVNTAEWAELLRNPRVKNRGIGIETGSTSLSLQNLCDALPYIIKGSPAKVFIYAGSRDLLGGATAAASAPTMRRAIKSLLTLNQSADIYVQSLLPTADAQLNTGELRTFNDSLQAICALSPRLHFVDLYTPFLATGGSVINPSFTLSSGTELSPAGYVKWANLIYKLIDPAITPLQLAAAPKLTPVASLTDVSLSGNAPYSLPDSVATMIKRLTSYSIALDIDLDATQPAGDVHTLFSASCTSKTNQFFTFSIYRNNAAFGVRYTKDDGAEGYFSSTGSLLGAEHRLVVTFNPTTSTYSTYLDGKATKIVSVAGTAWPFRTMGNVPSGNGMYLGGLVTSDAGNKYPLRGTIKRFSIYDKVLSASEVVTLSNAAEPDTLPTYRLSTVADTTWYYIRSTSTSSYCRGKVIIASQTDGERMTFGSKRTDGMQLWCMLKGDNDKIALRNFTTKRYMAADPATGTSEQPQYAYTITYYTGAETTAKGFTLQGSAASPLHAKSAGSVIVDWPVEAANPSSLWEFVAVEDSVLSKPCRIGTSTVEQGTVMTAIGRSDVPLLRSTLNVDGFTGRTPLDGVCGKVVNTSRPADVTRVSLFLAPNAYDLRPDKARRLATTVPAADGSFTLRADSTLSLSTGTYYLWLTADVSADAKEGSTVDLALSSYLCGSDTLVEHSGNPALSATVFLTESTTFYPGDYGSRYYRIPAIATAKDGSLVTVCDRRWSSEGDLPNNIDVVVRRSTDKGQTWSEPVTIAGTTALGGDYGHGDPAIVLDRSTGKLFVFVTSYRGFFYSTSADPDLVKVITSSDNGITWSKPLDITPQLFGHLATNAISRNWYGAFVTSGAALQTRDGTLMAALPVRQTSSNDCSNFVMLSANHGTTWKMQTGCAATGANEAKLIERNNGDLLISVRHGGNHIFNVSHDKGATWGTQYTSAQIWGTDCNGDMIPYTSTLDGFSRNRLLHTIPWASGRSNVSALISYDEGNTWTHRKTLCARGSAYSALCILPDGTIGCYIEDESLAGGYIMHFVRFSLSWLTDGEDHYEPATALGIHSVTTGHGTATDYVSLQGMNLGKSTPKKGIYISTKDRRCYKFQ